QEFQGGSMAQTIHAEQSAISHAWLRNESRITDIVVNYTPCGHCRQFMNELYQAEKISIHLPHSQHNPLHRYLPDAFGPKDLDIHTLLLNQENHQLDENHPDNLVQQAIGAANQAHCPYSNSPHGVAILFRNGTIITGRYAENAAFNPSLPALQTALNYAYLNNLDLAEIERIVLAEKSIKLSYKGMSEQLLTTISEVKLEYIPL
ncbi:cytidine deaminase, partial [uncultured Haemophilus sp.]|uniref:cytidine deaminase n=1 Tax=uncultured Haemophilus sp. TaxID=237779 RepID=UPI002585CED1